MLAVLVFPRATAALVKAHLPEGAFVIAVDAGADALHDAARRPDLLVGDMDSVTSETLVAFEAAGVPIERHPSSKRDTDAALALQRTRDHDEVLFLGAGGGRPDHALANLHLLAAASEWTAVRAIDERGEVWVVTPARPLDLALPVGTTVSTLPFDVLVEGIRLEGFEYPLKDAQMRAGDPYGISNVTNSPRQRVSVREGRLFVMAPRM